MRSESASRKRRSRLTLMGSLLATMTLLLPACGPDLAGEAVDADGQDAGSVSAVHPAFPVVSRNRGTVMQELTLVTILTPNDPDGEALDSFSDAIVQSPWWSQLAAEYGFAATARSVHLTGAALTTSPDTAGLQSYIQTTTQGTAYAPGNHSLYVVYLPPGVQLTDSSEPENGYHYPCCSGTMYSGDALAAVSGTVDDGPVVAAMSGETRVQSRTRTASHEIAEAVTNPDTSTGTHLDFAGADRTWNSVFGEAGGSEIADLCRLGNRYVLPGTDELLTQRIWSIAAAAAGGDPCVPHLSEPYYNTSAPEPWYAVAAGEKVSIPLTGWSTGPRSDWTIQSNIQAGECLGAPCTEATLAEWTPKLTTSLGEESPGGSACPDEPGMNNGATGTLTVSVSSTAQSGDYIVLGIVSVAEFPTSGCNTPLSSDVFHLWPVGVYVK